MPEPGRRSVNRRAGPGGGAGPFRRAPRSRPSLHTPGTAAAGRRPAPPCALTRPQAKDEAAAGTDPRPGAALIAPRGADAALRTAAPRPQQPRSGRLRPGPAPSHLSRCSPPPPHRWPRIYFRRRAGRAFPTPPEPAIWAELEPD